MIRLEGLLRRMSCSMSVDRVAAGSRASSTWMTTSAACTTFSTSLYAAFRVGSAHGSIIVTNQVICCKAVVWLCHSNLFGIPKDKHKRLNIPQFFFLHCYWAQNLDTAVRFAHAAWYKDARCPCAAASLVPEAS